MRDRSTSELRLHLCQCLSKEEQNRGCLVETEHGTVVGRESGEFVVKTEH